MGNFSNNSDYEFHFNAYLKLMTHVVVLMSILDRPIGAKFTDG